MTRVSRIKYTSDNLRSDSESETNDNKMPPARRSNRPRVVKHAEVLLSSESEDKSPLHPTSGRIREQNGKGAESSRRKRESVKYDGAGDEQESEHEDTVTGPEKITQKATVAVIKLKIPELSNSSKADKSAAKENPSRSLRERRNVTSTQNGNGNISTSEDESDDEMIVTRLGKTRTVKQNGASEEFRKIAANRKSGLRERKPVLNNIDIDSDNTADKRRKSDRIKTPTQRKYVEIDSDSSDDETKKTPKRGNTKKSGHKRSLSPNLSDSGKSDIYLSDSSLSDDDYHDKGRVKHSRQTNMQNRRKLGKLRRSEKPMPSSRSSDSVATSSVTGKNEEHKDLQRIYLTKQIEVLDHDLYLKKLEMLQKEKALKLPASKFTIALVNKQGE